MSEFVKTQQELRGNLVHQIQETIDSAEAEGRGLSAEETEKIDRIEADIRKADEAIQVAQRNEERKAEASLAARGFVVAEQEERGDADVLRGLAETRGMHTFEKRDIVSSDNTVPKSFFDQVFDVARGVGPLLVESEIINTATGEDLTIPTLTNYGTATLAAEGSAVGESDVTYSRIVLGSYRYGQLIQVSRELVTDAGFDIEAHLANAFGNSLGFAVNNALTVGTGTVEPNGVVTASGSGVTGGTAVSGAFTADNLIDLIYSLDGAARRLPGVAFMANTASVGAMRKLKDDNGQYLYQVGVGQPDSFAGFPIFENPAMADIGTEEKSVIFGHLPSYKVRMAGGLQVASSTDYAFNQDLTYYRFLMRVDGNLTHAGHIKHFIGNAS